MSNITEQDLIEAIDDVLSGRSVLKWDYFVSVTSRRSDIAPWIQRMKDLDEKYSDRVRGKLLTYEGIKKLRELRAELEVRRRFRDFGDTPLIPKP